MGQSVMFDIFLKRYITFYQKLKISNLINYMFNFIVMTGQ